MVSKRRNMFYENKKQETTEIAPLRKGVFGSYVVVNGPVVLRQQLTAVVTPITPLKIANNSDAGPFGPKDASKVVSTIDGIIKADRYLLFSSDETFSSVDSFLVIENFLLISGVWCGTQVSSPVTTYSRLGSACNNSRRKGVPRWRDAMCSVVLGLLRFGENRPQSGTYFLESLRRFSFPAYPPAERRYTFSSIKFCTAALTILGARHSDDAVINCVRCQGVVVVHDRVLAPERARFSERAT
ncbi:hypothetical protein AAG570_009798 [Ranatra chinensis]|uniref:Uncharacterized protein n=1 Tax=Ranatra chinensis TaxID=642074 RepID=A0ABD0YQ60_9HEMI